METFEFAVGQGAALRNNQYVANKLAKQSIVESQYNQSCDPAPSPPNETVYTINEEAISGMNQLCNALNELANRLGGSVPSNNGTAILEKAAHEPSIKDRARVLRGLVYLANEHAARIYSNLI